MGILMEAEPKALKKRRFEHLIFRDWCKSCGICVAFCPKKVFERDKKLSPVVARPEDCIGCRFCELHCPDFAITISEIGQGNGKEVQNGQQAT